MALADVAAAQNVDRVIKRRYELFKLGKTNRLTGPILSQGFTQSGRALPSLTRVVIKMNLAEPALGTCKAAEVAANFRLEIQDIKLSIKRLRPYASLLRSIEEKLDSGKEAQYYFQNRVIRKYTLPSGCCCCCPKRLR